MARKRIINNGFTLIEVLIAIAIIIGISGIAFVQLNPARRIAEANNKERLVEINTLINAIHQRIIDNEGVFEENCAAGAIPTTSTEIGRNNYNIEGCLVPQYIQSIPVDPTSVDLNSTGYFIEKNNTTGKITISAPNAELGETISITK